jgi:hypothetical protein
MAFMFPLAIGEAAGSRTRWVSGVLPSWLTQSTPLARGLAIAITALAHGAMTEDPGIALVSTASAMVAVAAAARWWRRSERHSRWDLTDLLPTDRQGKVIGLVLLLQYLVFIPLWGGDTMPPLLGHVVVWLLYAGFALLFRDARAESVLEIEPQVEISVWSRRRLIQWAIALLALSVLGSLGHPDVGAVIIWLVSIVVGLRTLVGVVRAIWRRGRRPTATPHAVRDGDQAHTS